MRMTVNQLYDIVNALVAISNQPRMIPAMAKFKLAKMHDALEPFHEDYERKRIALVQTHGQETFADPETKQKSMGWSVIPGTPGFEKYIEEWGMLTKEEIEVNVKPITLQMLGNDPKGIELIEFKQMGALIVDAEEERA